MANNVKREVDLYEPMRLWLQVYLESKYSNAYVRTYDSHSRNLDVVLEEAGVIDEYPQVVGLAIQIDVLGIVQIRKRALLVFIEAKKTLLNLHDLGQLWAYCKLCDPQEAFLLSSAGMGSLNKILVNLSREDLLDFGNKKIIKKMIVGKWSCTANCIDYKTLVPKIN